MTAAWHATCPEKQAPCHTPRGRRRRAAQTPAQTVPASAATLARNLLNASTNRANHPGNPGTKNAEEKTSKNHASVRTCT
jgi:hypothetical protein